MQRSDKEPINKVCKDSSSSPYQISLFRKSMQMLTLFSFAQKCADYFHRLGNDFMLYTKYSQILLRKTFDVKSIQYRIRLSEVVVQEFTSIMNSYINVTIDVRKRNCKHES